MNFNKITSFDNTMPFLPMCERVYLSFNFNYFADIFIIEGVGRSHECYQTCEMISMAG